MSNGQTAADQSASDLDGLPGIGAVRRAALAVAGITTRAQVARATVDQLVGITGIQRGYAIKAIAMAQASSPASSDSVFPQSDEALPNNFGFAEEPAASEPSAPEPEPPFALDISIFKATTALSDASRRYADSPALVREFLRFAKLIARLPAMAESASKKRKSRVALRLDRITVRLEAAASRKGKNSKSVAEKLRDVLRKDREAIMAIIAAKSQRTPKAKK